MSFTDFKVDNRSHRRFLLSLRILFGGILALAFALGVGSSIIGSIALWVGILVVGVGLFFLLVVVIASIVHVGKFVAHDVLGLARHILQRIEHSSCVHDGLVADEREQGYCGEEEHSRKPGRAYHILNSIHSHGSVVASRIEDEVGH